MQVVVNYDLLYTQNTGYLKKQATKNQVITNYHLFFDISETKLEYY